jgi:hypothetical protein
MERQLRIQPRDRVRELEDQLVSIRRKLLSVPEMDRHYADRMRVSVGEVVDAIGDALVRD